ncbi:hypothetical protein A2U01_0048124, partial [Trifolium medium]|nr:hypothetical protein [Trifolium medium]
MFKFVAHKSPIGEEMDEVAGAYFLCTWGCGMEGIDRIVWKEG